MRKLILFNVVTLNGFFEGPNRDIDWHNLDEEFNEFASHQLNSADGLIFGRVTYQLMADYWPSPNAIQDDPIIADKMNHLPKIVFSRTLDAVEWNNTRLIKENTVEEILKLKPQTGKDLLLFGSSNLAVTLIQNDLIDEYRIMVNPIAIGDGSPLFKGLQDKLILELIQTRTFRSGNVLLCYRPLRNADSL